jgi:uncharacterized Tic20 family protein
MDPLPEETPEAARFSGPEIPLQPPILPKERTWAMLAHLSAFAGHFIPFGHIFGPLLVWLLKRDTSAFVDDQGKEALNAQISVTIYGFAALLLCVVLIGIPLLVALWVADIVFIIMATVATNEGKPYRYPFNLRLVK